MWSLISSLLWYPAFFSLWNSRQHRGIPRLGTDQTELCLPSVRWLYYVPSDHFLVPVRVIWVWVNSIRGLSPTSRTRAVHSSLLLQISENGFVTRSSLANSYKVGYQPRIRAHVEPWSGLRGDGHSSHEDSSKKKPYFWTWLDSSHEQLGPNWWVGARDSNRLKRPESWFTVVCTCNSIVCLSACVLADYCFFGCIWLMPWVVTWNNLDSSQNGS